MDNPETLATLDTQNTGQINARVDMLPLHSGVRPSGFAINLFMLYSWQMSSK
jgi:hypothetical protein